MNKILEKAFAKEPVKNKTVKKASENEVLNKNAIEINPKMNEAVMKTAVLGWGRMNPITSGHEILVNKIKAVAKQNRATPIIYISHSQDAKKNPLSYNDKVMLAKKAFGNIIQKSDSKTIIQIMAELEDRFDKIILVAGDDRVSEFKTLLNKYNGSEYNFKEIEVVSAGKRADPDSDDAKDMSAANMSASVMRKLASQGDLEAFRKGLPKGLQDDYQEVYDLVRSGMRIAEMMEEEGELTEVLSFQQRRNRSLIMRKYRNKINSARKRLKLKAASTDMLNHRARQAAIKILRRKLAGKQGENYANLNPSEKMMIDKKIEKKKAAIQKIAARLLPTVRRADLQRLASAELKPQDSTPATKTIKKESVDISFEKFLGESMINEEFEALFEAVEMKQSIYTKRYHQMFTKEGKIKLDKRFRAFRTKPLEEGKILDRVLEKHKDEKEALAKRQSKENADARVREIQSTVKEDWSKKYKDSIDCNNPKGFSQKAHCASKKLHKEEFDTDAALLRFIEETTNDIYDSILLDEERSNEGLKDKAEKSGISLSILKQVYDRGMGAYQSSHRPGTTPQQWAFARVNSFITGGKTRTTADADLWAKHSGTKESVEEASKPGLWANIKKRRDAGLPRLKPGQDGYPKTLDIKEAGGAGDEATTKLSTKYKKDTPGQSVAEGLSEMDKSQTPPGRDGHVSHSTYGSRDSRDLDAGKKQYYGKMERPEKTTKTASDILNKAFNTSKKKSVAEGLTQHIYNILALDKGNALKKPTKLKWKASSLEDIFDALAAQDWYPLEINGVEVIAGKRLKQGMAEGLTQHKREDDEYHNGPDLVNHTYNYTVSKNGGEKHQRSVTTPPTRAPKHAVEPMARAHLKKQGYTIHESNKGAICQNCLVDPCICDDSHGFVKENSSLDRFKKYIRPVVKTTPKIEKSTNPAGRTTDHTEWKVTTHTGEVHRHATKKAAQAHFDSLPKGVTESSGQILSKGTTVTVVHKGKQVKGKIVRYDAGKNGYSNAYVVDVGEYESIMVPVSKIKMESVTEEVSQQQLNDLEKFADRLLAKFKIDVEFTRHFADRMNDDRNKPAITVGELQKVFKKIASHKGAEIRQNPDIEAVLKDIQSDLNLPIVINYDKNKDEFEVVNKTIMRKKNFGTTSKVISI